MSKVVNITNINEYELFKNSHKRGVILYGATWCQGCKDIEPLYTRIANRYYKRIAMAYADIDVCKLEFSRVPVLVSFHKGILLNSIVGVNRERLKEFIKNTIEYNPDEGISNHPPKRHTHDKLSPKKFIKNNQHNDDYPKIHIEESDFSEFHRNISVSQDNTTTDEFDINDEVSNFNKSSKISNSSNLIKQKTSSARGRNGGLKNSITVKNKSRRTYNEDSEPLKHNKNRRKNYRDIRTSLVDGSSNSSDNSSNNSSNNSSDNSSNTSSGDSSDNSNYNKHENAKKSNMYNTNFGKSFNVGFNKNPYSYVEQY